LSLRPAAGSLEASDHERKRMASPPEPANRPTPSERPSEGPSLSLAGKGPLRCGSCGYEIVSYRMLLPPCPMCRELQWERTRWRPFTRQPTSLDLDSLRPSSPKT
jgi:hypothetical protein